MADLQAHTQRWQHHRAPTFVACSTDDCHLAAYRRGMCDRHYRRALAAGELERLTPEARFWSKVEKTETCWIWRGARDDKGYGSLGINGKILRAHRVSYEWLIGPIPEGLVLDHLCRVPPCVNPAHLEPVTQGENSRRGIRGDQLRLEDKCRSGRHPWPESARYYESTGKSMCVECWKLRRDERAARKESA